MTRHFILFGTLLYFLLGPCPNSIAQEREPGAQAIQADSPTFQKLAPQERREALLKEINGGSKPNGLMNGFVDQDGTQSRLQFKVHGATLQIRRTVPRERFPRTDDWNWYSSFSHQISIHGIHRDDAKYITNQLVNQYDGALGRLMGKKKSIYFPMRSRVWNLSALMERLRQSELLKIDATKEGWQNDFFVLALFVDRKESYFPTGRRYYQATAGDGEFVRMQIPLTVLVAQMDQGDSTIVAAVEDAAFKKKVQTISDHRRPLGLRILHWTSEGITNFGDIRYLTGEEVQTVVDATIAQLKENVAQARQK